MKVNRQILASIFLVLFGTMQLADLHVIGHDDDADDIECSVCKFTLNYHSQGFTPADTIAISDIIKIPVDVVQTTYVNRYFGSSIIYSILNKAPPVA